MISTKRAIRPSFAEFVILVSLMMSVTAMSIDAMLPALAQMGSEFNIANANDRQLVISTIFLGLAFGQLFFGPLSDRTGRKPAIYIGFALYIAGSLLSMFAFSFTLLLFGRLLQGIGVSSPRTVTLALVRDQYEGRAMARVMSFVMTVFVLVPMIAPSLGQAILLVSGWRAIFGSFVLLTAVILVWFGLRMPETLAADRRASFSLRRILAATRQVIGIRPAIGYTVTAGLISGAFIGYLNSSQQIFQEQYALGDLFPLFFAVMAFSVGVASFLNSRLVVRFGMRFLVRTALIVILALSLALLATAVATAGHPPVWLFMIMMIPIHFWGGNRFG
ncbi:MAG: MFS transporter, partial [Candidatus Promineifilaceae bacterium]|nr:MFS transporter [Candidatus Promineifilaceae bacterium]